MKVTLKAEITKISTEKDQLDEKLKDKNDEIARLNNTIQRLFARPMDSIEKREEMELQKQFKINELEEIIATLEKDKLNLQEELYKANETNLSLKFEKETYDLQYARLQKRIKDLDQYKESTSGLSAKLAQQEQEDLEEIDEQVGKSESLKKRKDTNKFRKRPM
jgi:vacuolar-type H+-ATPase subunit I/STV1